MAGRRIYLVGSSGYPHYGDELVAASWLRHLARTEPDAEVWLDCHNPGGAPFVFDGLHPNLHYTDTLFRLSWAAPSDDPEEVLDYAARAVRQPGLGYAHRAAGVELLHTADVFHVIGGNYLAAIWPRHLTFLAAGAVLADEHGVRSAMTGQSLLPATTTGEVLDRLTAGFAVVDVADARSRALLSGDTVTSTGDDVFLDLGDHVYDGRESVSTMICIQSDWLACDVEALVTGVVETARSWGLRGDKVGYIEAIPGQDRVVFDKIAPALEGMRFYPFNEVWRAGLPARRGQRWITTRPELHAVAAARGAWGVAIPVRPGFDDVHHKELVDRGSRWAIGAPGEVAPEAHGEHGFGTARDGLVEAKQAVAAHLYGR